MSVLATAEPDAMSIVKLMRPRSAISTPLLSGQDPPGVIALYRGCYIDGLSEYRRCIVHGEHDKRLVPYGRFLHGPFQGGCEWRNHLRRR
jgi:hypothetical protein